MIHKWAFCRGDLAHLHVCLLKLILVSCLFSSKILAGNLLMLDFTNYAIWSNLSEHLHWIKPDFDTLKLQAFVDFSDSDTLDVNLSTMGLSSDLFAFATMKSASCAPICLTDIYTH